ncbi:28S ribosomal protein S24, mitochondrial, partial [Armadillidium nasatum]
FFQKNSNAILDMNYPKSLAYLVSFRNFSTSLICQKSQAGRYKTTKFQTFPLTYEMANKPDQIGHRKAWNSWNTSNLYEGMREPETIVDDIFIRKFMTGTWHNMFVSEVSFIFELFFRHCQIL